jgi:hypothetical protein
VDVSQSDNELLDELPYGAQTFGANRAGGLTITWADIGGAIRVIARQTSGGIWGALQTAVRGNCAGGTNCTAASATAINDAGAEIVTWAAQSPNGSIALNVATAN